MGGMIASANPQQVLDCVQTADSNGCSGGTPMDGMDWLATNQAANPLSLPGIYEGYPISSPLVPGTCKSPDPNNPQTQIISWGWTFTVPQCPSDDCGEVGGVKELDLLHAIQSVRRTAIAYVDASKSV